VCVDGSRSVGLKGRQTLLQYCALCSYTELNDYLNSSPLLVYVHDACYWDYTNKRRYEQEAYGETDMQDGLKAKLLRLSDETFSF
jgi:hypothetical protein